MEERRREIGNGRNRRREDVRKGGEGMGKEWKVSKSEWSEKGREERRRGEKGQEEEIREENRGEKRRG